MPVTVAQELQRQKGTADPGTVRPGYLVLEHSGGLPTEATRQVVSNNDDEKIRSGNFDQRGSFGSKGQREKKTDRTRQSKALGTKVQRADRKTSGETEDDK